MVKFPPYRIALKLKKNKFNDPCMKWYYRGKLNDESEASTMGRDFWFTHNYRSMNNDFVSAPMYQQITDWFLLKHKIFFKTYHCHHTNTWKVVAMDMNIFDKESNCYWIATIQRGKTPYTALNKSINSSLDKL